jgi:hypothetical protein
MLVGNRALVLLYIGSGGLFGARWCSDATTAGRVLDDRRDLRRANVQFWGGGSRENVWNQCYLRIWRGRSVSGPLCAQTPPTGKVLSEDDYESSEWAVLIKL